MAQRRAQSPRSKQRKLGHYAVSPAVFKDHIKALTDSFKEFNKNAKRVWSSKAKSVDIEGRTVNTKDILHEARLILARMKDLGNFYQAGVSKKGNFLVRNAIRSETGRPLLKGRTGRGGQDAPRKFDASLVNFFKKATLTDAAGKTMTLPKSFLKGYSSSKTVIKLFGIYVASNNLRDKENGSIINVNNDRNFMAAFDNKKLRQQIESNRAEKSKTTGKAASPFDFAAFKQADWLSISSALSASRNNAATDDEADEIESMRDEVARDDTAVKVVSDSWRAKSKPRSRASGQTRAKAIKKKTRPARMIEQYVRSPRT